MRPNHVDIGHLGHLIHNGALVFSDIVLSPSVLINDHKGLQAVFLDLPHLDFFKLVDNIFFICIESLVEAIFFQTAPLTVLHDNRVCFCGLIRYAAGTDQASRGSVSFALFLSVVFTGSYVGVLDHTLDFFSTFFVNLTQVVRHLPRGHYLEPFFAFLGWHLGLRPR
jgi:hypothetical protein